MSLIRNRSLVLILLLLSDPAGAVDFKGIELGQPLWLTQERSIFGVLDCNPMQLDPDQYQSYLHEMQQLMPGVRKVCAGTTSIATVPANVTVLLGTSRKVLRLTFQFAAADYRHVFDAMTAKWGEGISEVRDEFDESVWWDFADGSSVSIHKTPNPDGPATADKQTLIGLAEYSLPVTSPAGDL